MDEGRPDILHVTAVALIGVSERREKQLEQYAVQKGREGDTGRKWEDPSGLDLTADISLNE